MKALSLRADYAMDILTGDKTVEYRSWKTDYRGDLLICATQKKIPGTIPGHALIVCELVDIKRLEDGQYAWQLDNFRTIYPFPVKGKLKLFDVDDDLIHLTDLENASQEDIDYWVDKYINPLLV